MEAVISSALVAAVSTLPLTCVAEGAPATPPPPEPQAVPQTIRIDPEVWRALQGQAVPLVETANDALRRLLGLGSRKEQ
jgi:hypothetical protein